MAVPAGPRKLHAASAPALQYMQHDPWERVHFPPDLTCSLQAAGGEEQRAATYGPVRGLAGFNAQRGREMT